jgi:hypothetical protein
MNVQVQGVTEALNEGHRAGLRIRERPAPSRPAPERCKESADENAQDCLGKPGIEG